MALTMSVLAGSASNPSAFFEPVLQRKFVCKVGMRWRIPATVVITPAVADNTPVRGSRAVRAIAQSRHKPRLLCSTRTLSPRFFIHAFIISAVGSDTSVMQAYHELNSIVVHLCRFRFCLWHLRILVALRSPCSPRLRCAFRRGAYDDNGIRRSLSNLLDAGMGHTISNAIPSVIILHRMCAQISSSEAGCLQARRTFLDVRNGEPGVPSELLRTWCMGLSTPGPTTEQ